ncbi:MAG: Gfo/Idh/MocA family oxidoreductase [bacterium]|nr:Gfo/Idh/MocA family oxidoreductase [bacterium]
MNESRRNFLLQSTSAVAASLAPAGFFTTAAQAASKSSLERPGIGAIGLKYQGSVVTKKAQKHGDVVALCDVDKQILEKGQSDFGGKSRLFEDYRELLERDDVDVVTIGTPDHWHTKIAVDAMRAGKDVYVEKPLTLTVDEGKILTRVAKETGRVVQVGSWQRSDSRFRLAVEMVHAGRVGKLQRVDVVLAKHPTGGPFKTQPAPKHLNWDLWQGQTPDTPYIPERCHYTFRWWYEYSGGKMTDWGAHHLDIAQWGINSLPVEVDGKAKLPNVKNGYNVAIDYGATYKYQNGVVMTVADSGRNGIMFTGDRGRLFVNRGQVVGKPVEDLKSNPLPRDGFKLYSADNLSRPERAGKLDAIINHMGNFFDCIVSRKTPISDVVSQHQSATTCHIGNISMRLGRPLKWDPVKEVFINDAAANAMLKREQRSGFEIV